MQTISATALLNFWERNMNQTLIHRAIDLLCCAYPEMKVEEIARLSIGERDARLLLLRRLLFGPHLQNMAECPGCSARIVWENDIQDILLQLPSPNASRGEYLLEEEGYNIFFRLPNSFDLLEVIAGEIKNANPEKLLEKLILDCKYMAEPCLVEKLPGNIINALDQKIEDENQQADILMDLKCPNCSHQFEMQFDIVSYIWNEINTWARHLLQDIGTLARAYGWSEKEILELSPARRQIYLDMAYS